MQKCHEFKANLDYTERKEEKEGKREEGRGGEGKDGRKEASK